MRQLTEWVAQLHAVPPPVGLEEGPIASLRFVEGSVRADRPLVIVDGPTLPKSSRQSFKALAEAILKEMGMALKGIVESLLGGEMTLYNSSDTLTSHTHTSSYWPCSACTASSSKSRAEGVRAGRLGSWGVLLW